MSRLETQCEQVGHRVRMITTGGRSRRRATTADIDSCVTYLESVADRIEQYDLVVESVAVDGRKPISGRIRLRTISGQTIPGCGAVVSLAWQHGFGWSTTTHGADAPRGGWFHLYADDAATPAIVTEFLLDEILPKDLWTGRPGDPGSPAVAS